MVPDFVRIGFTAEIPLSNQGSPARSLDVFSPPDIDSSRFEKRSYSIQDLFHDIQTERYRTHQTYK